MKFAHLHLHSHYSLLDGMSTIDEILSRVKELEMESAALTDHGNLYGAIEFYKKAKEKGIHPVIGCELYLAPRTIYDKDPNFDANYFHLLVFAKNNTGYKNLLKLISLANLEGFYYKPRVDKNLLKEYHEGLIATSGCLTGEIPKAILNKNKNKIKTLVEEYLAIFGKDDFYIEFQHHPEIKEQQIVNEELKKIAKDYNLKTILTCDSHYPNSTDREVHDIFLSIQTGSNVSDPDRLTMKDADFSIKDPKDIFNDIKDDKDLVEAFNNTYELAQRCQVEITLGENIFPVFKTPNGEDNETYLKKLAIDGLHERYPKITKEIQERFDYELKVITQRKLTDYFLIVQDFINWAKNQDIVIGPGRGSVVGSIIAYCLHITEIDPLKHGLIFERFINLERMEMPDVDTDVQDNRREEIIRYLEERYGKDRVAQISTFGVMKARLAVRDVARALGFPYSLGDKISKLIPFNAKMDEALEISPELKELYQTNPDAKLVIDYAKRLEGLVRHASVHAAGVVVAPGPLTDYAPLQYSARGNSTIATQYEMHSVEDIGLLKIDLLGIAYLTVIKNTLRIIKKLYNKEIDLSSLSEDDPKVYEILSKGETIGVFQVESSGMRRYLKELKPSNFEEIVVMVALYRPGPMELIPSYINRKWGREKISYLHPKLEPIFKPTYGIGIYQEQMMQIARDLADFSLGEADVLRKAIGKKNKELLDSQKQKLIEGMMKNGIPKETAEKIWELFLPFARYGFNKSHAVGYAKVVYYTAYLKAHYPQAFMAALLTAHFGNLDKIAIEIGECRRLGIKIIPPDINKSFVEFGVDPETKNIIFSLAAIKGVGTMVAEIIQEERKQNGVYKSLTDFIKRMPKNIINRKTMESLIKAGVFDSFYERNQLLQSLDEILKFAYQFNKNNQTNQLGLFAGNIENLKIPKVEPLNKKDKLNFEKEYLGLYLSDHPLNEYRAILTKLSTPFSKVNNTTNGQRVRIGGLIENCQKIITKNGKLMLFSKLEDLSNNKIEVVVFPDILEKSKNLWQENNVILVDGKINNYDGEMKVICESVRTIESI